MTFNGHKQQIEHVVAFGPTERRSLDGPTAIVRQSLDAKRRMTVRPPFGL